MDIIKANDQICLISGDEDFYRLLRYTVGDDAAQWYKERIEAVDERVEKLRPFADRTRYGKRPSYADSPYDYSKILALPKEDLAEVAAIAFTIRGWDEHE